MSPCKRLHILAALSIASALLASPLWADNCTFTMGYWKNNPNAWPVPNHMLGNVSYGPEELLAILGQPVEGNGLVALAHQLIAAKLNIAFGAESDAIDEVLYAADQMVGNRIVPPIGEGSLPPSSTSSLTAQLDAFNRGDVGPGHCDFVNAAESSSWGRVKMLYR